MDEQNLNRLTCVATLKLIAVNEFDNLKLENIELKPRIEELKKDKHFFTKCCTTKDINDYIIDGIIIIHINYNLQI